MLFSRPDGTPATDVAPFRRIMPFIMKGRNESAVFFEQKMDLSKTLPFIAAWNEQHPELRVTVFHLLMFGLVKALHERPRLNRFVMGGRIWQRDGVWMSFSAKKRLEDGSPIVVVKRKFEAGLNFEALVKHVYGDLLESRSDKASHVDKELSIFLRLPGPILRLGVSILTWLDRWNLLPGSFIHPDPMYASMFVANLGSVKLDSAYHHLYEYGNCPFFAALGRTHTEATAQGPREICSVKYTFDERVEDGLYCARALELVRATVENPEGA